MTIQGAGQPGHWLRVDAHGSGPPHFLCLHGLADTLEIWDPLVEPLSKRGQVLRIDQRGHGESGAPPGPYRREDLAADAIAVLDERGVERAILVGHSLGGIVSMVTALEYSDRIAALVLIGTASRCSEKVAGWYERIARAGERDGCVGLARTIYGERGTKTISGDARGIADVTRVLKSLYDAPLTAKLTGLCCPSLLLVGERDPMGPRASETIAGQIRDSELEVVPDCGHWVHVEAPETVVAAIDRLLISRSLV